MTNFDIAAILPELRQHTIGARIHNVYQFTDRAFLFKAGPGNLNLVVEPAKRIHLTKFEVKTPAKPSQLCMAFRKHVRAARIVAIEQPDFERVVVLEVERQGNRHKIIVELLPRGNLILVDDMDKVVVSSRYLRMRDRCILRGQPLKLPPARGKNLIEVTSEEIRELRSLGQVEVAKAVSGSLGVAGTLVEEILRRAQVDKSTPATRLSDDQIRGIFQVISNLRETVTKGPLFPIVVLDDSRMIDVAPFELELYTDKKKRTFTSFNEAVDEYFTTATSSRQAQERERVYADKKLELQRRLESQKKQLAEIVSSTKVLKDTGDLIFRHLGEIQLALNFVSDARRSKQSLRSVEDILVKEDRSGIRVHPHVQKLSASGDRVTFVFDGEPIEVEVRKRPQDEAAEYYQKAKRLESKLSGLERSIADTETLIQKLTSQEIELTRPARPEPQVEKEWFEKFRWFESSEGVLVVGGRDAASNETLLKRYVGPEDLVMHAEAHGAPFFVVKTETGQPREDTMMETAQACLSYSRLWKEGIHSGDAYWVKPSQVTKSAPAGEYLTKGAFMIRGTRTYLRGVELGLAIGMASRDDKLLMMGGPLKAAKSNCAVFVTISQGKGSPAETARRILTIFKSKADESTRLKLQRIKIDDVIRLLPPGGVDVANSISP